MLLTTANQKLDGVTTNFDLRNVQKKKKMLDTIDNFSLILFWSFLNAYNSMKETHRNQSK